MQVIITSRLGKVPAVHDNDVCYSNVVMNFFNLAMSLRFVGCMKLTLTTQNRVGGI